MKRLFRTVATLGIVATAAVGCTCKPEQFSGFVVCKEYTPAHMSNKAPMTIQQAVFIPYHHVHSRPAPHRIASRWTIWVANKHATHTLRVDSLTYTRIELGQRFTIHK